MLNKASHSDGYETHKGCASRAPINTEDHDGDSRCPPWGLQLSAAALTALAVSS